jgi:glutathione S-transferase
MLLASDYTASFCYGATPGLADCFIVPQVYNARRFGVNLTAFPTLVGIAERCEKLPAFVAAHPKNQKDAV